MIDTIRTLLIRDADDAERCTRCKRRGCAARAVDSDANTVLNRCFNGSDGCTADVAGCGCLHAEQKLVLQLAEMRCTKGQLTLLTTLEPCAQCANLIVACGYFRSCLWLRPYHDNAGQRILQGAGIDARQVGPIIRCQA